MKQLKHNDASAEDMARAKRVTDEAAKHLYNSSLIYSVYNRITGKNEATSTCASCLRTRAKIIAAWLSEARVVEEQPAVEERPVVEEAPAERMDVVINGRAAYFENDKLKWADTNRGVAAGTYTSEAGDEFKVQPGGVTKMTPGLL